MGEKPLRILVFGRAGEEITKLRAQGIAVAFAPGITAGSAMSAELGASLTHREHAHSVRFVTAHSRQVELPADLDWRGLADCETTLVFYMGGRTAPTIAARLMHEGLYGATPVVIQEAVSRPEARLTRMTLERLADPDVFAFGGEPTLIDIGRVFAGQAIDARRILDDAVAGQPCKQASA